MKANIKLVWTKTGMTIIAPDFIELEGEPVEENKTCPHGIASVPNAYCQLCGHNPQPLPPLPEEINLDNHETYKPFGTQAHFYGLSVTGQLVQNQNAIIRYLRARQ